MERHRWDDDEALLDDLGRAMIEAGPLADMVARLGRGAFAWRSVDDDLVLASLSFDSSVDREMTSREGTGETRVLVFTASPLTVELELWSDRIAGQLLPAGAGEVVVESADGITARVDADEFGFFLIPIAPEAPVRLRCDTVTAKLVTDWFQP